MNRLKSMFLSLGVIVTAIPGLQSIQNGLMTPPDLGNLFGGTQIAMSSFALLAVLAFRREVSRMNRRRLTRLSGYCLIASLVCLSTYMLCLSHCKISLPAEPPTEESREFYFPLWLNGDLARAVSRSSRIEAATLYRRHLPDLLAEHGTALTTTTVLLLVLHVGTFTGLVIAFALLGFRVGMRDPIFADTTGNTRNLSST